MAPVRLQFHPRGRSISGMDEGPPATTFRPASSFQALIAALAVCHNNNNNIKKQADVGRLPPLDRC